MSFAEYSAACRDHLGLLERWQATGQLLVEKQGLLHEAGCDAATAELQLRREVDRLQHEVHHWRCRADQSWCQLAPSLYVAFLGHREVSGSHLMMAQNELVKLEPAEQLELVRAIVHASEAGYLPQFESLYAQLSQTPAGSSGQDVHAACPTVLAMLKELTAPRKRMRNTTVPASLEHVYGRRDNLLVDVGEEAVPPFVADQAELDSIDFHVNQLRHKPSNVRRLGMAYQRRQIVAAIFDPVLRSLAASDAAIRPIWRDTFYGSLATFYNAENEAEAYRFAFAPAMAITVPYDVCRSAPEQRAGMHYQGMARKEVGELGFFIMEVIDDTQCNVCEARSKFFAQMMTAVCGQELVPGMLVDASHAYKPFCTGIILTNQQVQFYMVARRAQVDSDFEVYHYADCELYTVGNRGKCYNTAALIDASILFRNQADMLRRHLRHFQPVAAVDTAAAAGDSDGFHAYRQVVARLSGLGPLPEFVASGFARISSRDSIAPSSSIDQIRGGAGEGMNVDDDYDDSPQKIIVKKSSITLERRISQMFDDSEELQALVANYLTKHKLVAQPIHVYKAGAMCTDHAQHKWHLVAQEGVGQCDNRFGISHSTIDLSSMGGGQHSSSPSLLPAAASLLPASPALSAASVHSTNGGSGPLTPPVLGPIGGTLSSAAPPAGSSIVATNALGMLPLPTTPGLSPASVLRGMGGRPRSSSVGTNNTTPGAFMPGQSPFHPHYPLHQPHGPSMLSALVELDGID
ncbi:hypothetical protein SYNPS1DRAFT_29287, partial [Syncephalis pseudoplumigaleata]